MVSPRRPELTADLVRRAVEGDAQATRELVGAATPLIQVRVGRVLLRCGGHAGRRDVRAEVEDFTQEVLLRWFASGWRAVLRWKPGGLSFLNFVGLLAGHEAVSIARARGGNPWKDPPTAPEQIDRILPPDSRPKRRIESRALLERLLQRMRERLSPDQFELFWMDFVEERSVEEICATMEANAAAVYQRRHRLRDDVRRIADELMSETPPEPT